MNTFQARISKLVLGNKNKQEKHSFLKENDIFKEHSNDCKCICVMKLLPPLHSIIDLAPHSTRAEGHYKIIVAVTKDSNW